MSVQVYSGFINQKLTVTASGIPFSPVGGAAATIVTLSLSTSSIAFVLGPRLRFKVFFLEAPAGAELDGSSGTGVLSAVLVALSS